MIRSRPRVQLHVSRWGDGGCIWRNAVLKVHKYISSSCVQDRRGVPQASTARAADRWDGVVAKPALEVNDVGPDGIRRGAVAEGFAEVMRNLAAEIVLTCCIAVPEDSMFRQN